MSTSNKPKVLGFLLTMSRPSGKLNYTASSTLLPVSNIANKEIGKQLINSFLPISMQTVHLHNYELALIDMTPC